MINLTVYIKSSKVCCCLFMLGYKYINQNVFITHWEFKLKQVFSYSLLCEYYALRYK